MTKKQQARIESLLPKGKPKYIRCYDNQGETADRYTIVFSKLPGFNYVAASAHPTHPAMGIYMHMDNSTVGHAVDYPTYGHLGKKITYDKLPDTLKSCILRDYKDMWNLNN